MSTRARVTTDDRPRSESVKKTYGEDPARFLACSEKHLPLSRIRGIRNAELLEAWRAVEKSKFSGRSVILDALDRRERELSGDEIEAEPLEADDSEPEPEFEPETTDDPAPEPEPTPTHADVTDVLEPGQALRVDRGEKVEYIFPTTAAAESPYVSKTFDAETGDPWMEADVSPDTVSNRRQKDAADVVPLESVAKDRPDHAATEDDQ